MGKQDSEIQMCCEEDGTQLKRKRREGPEASWECDAAVRIKK